MKIALIHINALRKIFSHIAHYLHRNTTTLILHPFIPMLLLTFHSSGSLHALCMTPYMFSFLCMQTHPLILLLAYARVCFY